MFHFSILTVRLGAGGIVKFLSLDSNAVHSLEKALPGKWKSPGLSASHKIKLYNLDELH